MEKRRGQNKTGGGGGKLTILLELIQGGYLTCAVSKLCPSSLPSCAEMGVVSKNQWLVLGFEPLPAQPLLDRSRTLPTERHNNGTQLISKVQWPMHCTDLVH